MIALNVPNETFHHKDGIVYEQLNGNHVGTTTERIIHILSKNRIYPRIKFDRQYELIYDDKANKYVIGPTIKQAFFYLFIAVFS